MRLLSAHLGPDQLARALDIDRIVARARTLLGADTPLVDVLLIRVAACNLLVHGRKEHSAIAAAP